MIHTPVNAATVTIRQSVKNTVCQYVDTDNPAVSTVYCPDSCSIVSSVQILTDIELSPCFTGSLTTISKCNLAAFDTCQNEASVSYLGSA
jgi:hypothetical protein